MYISAVASPVVEVMTGFCAASGSTLRRLATLAWISAMAALAS
jgi:hypothetical protein